MSEPEASSSDFSRVYCWAMLLVSAFLGYMLFKASKEADAFALANDAAKGVFGSPEPSPKQEDKPTQIRFLGVGILKYIETYKAATLKGTSTLNIPLEKVKERANLLGLQAYQWGQETDNKNSAKGYVETFLPVTFEKTDLDHLAKFLYNLEGSSTKLRTLEVKWDLLPEKENPPTPGPGHLIQRPQVKIGVRRPITAKDR